MKSGFCACAITFQTQSTTVSTHTHLQLSTDHSVRCYLYLVYLTYVQISCNPEQKKGLNFIFHLFWAFTLRRVPVSYRHFGTSCRSHFQGLQSPGPLTLEDATSRFSQNFNIFNFLAPEIFFFNFSTPCI